MNGTERAESETIKTIFRDECPCLRGKSTLPYEVGADLAGEKLFLRVPISSLGGRGTELWMSDENIARVINSSNKLAGTSVRKFQPGKSRNTGPFILAALLDLGLVRPCKPKSRYHEHVPQTSFAQLVMKRMKEIEEKKLPTRK